jgi:membrane protease YdiL (CAAX protease family)
MNEAQAPAYPEVPDPFPFRGPVSALLACFYLLGFGVVWYTLGPWEAVRRFAVEGVILILWLGAAHLLLKDEPARDAPVKKPRLELILALLGLPALAGLAVVYFNGARWLRYVPLAALIPLFVMIPLGYRGSAFGLKGASRRAWAALLVILLINWTVGPLLGAVLPEGEFAEPPGADLSQGLTGPAAVVILLVQFLVLTAIPEELYFRVFLQTRLARFAPLGWAILLQALFFSAIHIPQQALSYHYPWALIAAEALSVNNGIIGGYFWRRTRSLPLLLILHLFAYPRIGL